MKAQVIRLLMTTTLSALLMLVFPLPSHAQTNPLSIVPASPIDGTQFQLRTTVDVCSMSFGVLVESSNDRELEILGNSISVTVRGYPQIICTPVPNYNVYLTLGPLDAGSYHLDLIGQDLNYPGNLYSLGSIDFTVRARAVVEQPSSIPSASVFGLIALFGLLAVSGFRAMCATSQ